MFDLDPAAAVLLHKSELKGRRNLALMIATYAATLISGEMIELDDWAESRWTLWLAAFLFAFVTALIIFVRLA